MPGVGPARPGIVWALTWAVSVLAVFTLVASLRTTLVFAPAQQSSSTIGVALVGFTASIYALIGGLICARTSNLRIGALLLALGWVVGITLGCMAWAGLDLPGAALAAGFSGQVSVTIFPLIALLIVLFPDGHLLSARWRPALGLIVVVLVVGLAVPQRPIVPEVGGTAQAAASWLLRDEHLTFTLIPFTLVLAAISLVLRYRGSSGATRAQLKWFSLAAVTLVCAEVLQNLTWALSGTYGRTVGSLGFVVLIVGFNAVPLACGVAILRYHLYDIDRVVSRSVAYLAVTAFVVGVYLVVVAGLTRIFPVQTNLAVALATLTAASLLEPTRRRVQHAVDRRFNRARYDALRTVGSFGDRLSHEIDTTTVESDLIHTVAATLQPASVTLWPPRR